MNAINNIRLWGAPLVMERSWFRLPPAAPLPALDIYSLLRLPALIAWVLNYQNLPELTRNLTEFTSIFGQGCSSDVREVSHG